jgi:hypothetical protein
MGNFKGSRQSMGSANSVGYDLILNDNNPLDDFCVLEFTPSLLPMEWLRYGLSGCVPLLLYCSFMVFNPVNFVFISQFIYPAVKVIFNFLLGISTHRCKSFA